MIGKVWITGAGSEAGLITVRGLQAVRGAEVIVYDDLVDHAILGEAPEGCELICVGKRKNAHKMEQEEIHEVLLDRARKGLKVVRLKGGDPTVFGRGGEEALAMEAAGIPYEMIPGVSSCIAAPEHFGISITQRGLASSVTVVTGHGAGKTAESYDVLAGIKGSLVFLMGHSKAGEIADGLMKAGKDPQTPACVLSCAFMPGEKRVDGCLGNLGEIAKQAQAPSILVIGQTAAMHLASPEAPAETTRHTALVVGTRSFTAKMAAALRKDGVGAVEFPCVELVAQKQEIPEGFEEYDWLVFTSANGVRIFLEELGERKTDLRKLAHLKIACIGSGTAAALSEAHLYADLVPETFTSEGLAQALVNNVGKDEKILILRAAEGNPLLTNKLKNEKILYRDCRIYRAQYSDPAGRNETLAGSEEPAGRNAEPCGGTGDPAQRFFDRKGEAAEEPCDLIVFASAGGVRSFLENNGLPESVQPFCIGALTAAELERLTGRKAVVARECSVEGIRKCVETWGR